MYYILNHLCYTLTLILYFGYLKIAKAKDGRNILYAVNLDINKGIAVDQGATQKRAAVLAAMPSEETVAQNEPDVKTQYSLSPVESVEFHRQKDADVQHSYSRPDFNKEEWAIVNRRKHREFDNPKYDLDNDTKWMYFNEKGSTVFAVYSKHDADDPTVLYGTSGKKAQRDYADLNDYLSGRRKNAKRNWTAFDRWIGAIERNNGNGSTGVYPTERGQSAIGDVPIPLEEQGSNGRRDFGDGTENIRAEELTEYDNEASEESDASSITFSNDYAAYRNFMKEGNTGETDIRFSLSKPVVNQFDASKEQSAESKFLKYKSPAFGRAFRVSIQLPALLQRRRQRCYLL